MHNEHNRIRSHQSKAWILVVEDDPEIAGTILEVLVHEGFQVEIAENGKRALNLLMNGIHFDLLIANMTMRKIDGLELLRQVYQLRTNLPVIVIKRYPALKNGFRSIEEGPFEYMSNPFGVKLRNVVHEALKGYS